MPCPAVLVMNGATGLLAEAGVSFGVDEVKMVASKIFKLVLGKAQFPGNICPPDGESVVISWGERHGIVVK